MDPGCHTASPNPHQPFHHLADIASEAKLGEQKKRTGRIMYSVWADQLSTRYISAAPTKKNLVLLSYSNTAVNSLRMSTASIASVSPRGPSTLRIFGIFPTLRFLSRLCQDRTWICRGCGGCLISQDVLKSGTNLISCDLICVINFTVFSDLLFFIIISINYELGYRWISG